ncbi:MAG: HEAT repeat domain-containing protein [Candidatus Latescibacterota bacterium]|nr:HEAT repeat domain-containing protein [Candidatus Latescibacterota bacterium]
MDYLVDIRLLRLGRLFLIVAVILSTSACAIRRIPPIRYLPGLGSKASNMEAILEHALKDKNPVVRLDAVRLLGTMNATREEQRKSAAALGRALNDKDEITRLEVVRALANYSPDIAGPYLMKAMHDESIRIRIQVVMVLRRSYETLSTQTDAVTQNQ